MAYRPIAIVLVLAVSAFAASLDGSEELFRNTPHRALSKEGSKTNLFVAKLALYYQKSAIETHNARDDASEDILHFVNTCQINAKGLEIIVQKFGRPLVEAFCKTQNQEISVIEDPEIIPSYRDSGVQKSNRH